MTVRIAPGKVLEGGGAELLIGDEGSTPVGQTEGVMFTREEGGVDGPAPPLPVHVGEHLPDGEVVQRRRGLDPDLDQQLYQQRPVIGEILFNLECFKMKN